MKCIDLADYNLFRGTYLLMGIASAHEVTLPCGNLEPDFQHNPLFQAGGCINGGCGDAWKGSSSNGLDRALYFNPTSAATAVIQCADDVFAPYIKCGPSNDVLFSDYEGSWEYVGGGASVSWTAGYSWSQSETDTYSQSFSYGFSQELKVKSGVPGIASTTMTVGATQQVNKTSTQSITQANQQGGSYTCANSETIANCDGSIYQWRVTANAHSSSGFGSSFVTDCSFVCVPSALPAGDEPKCPDKYCSSRVDGCQCCNSIWRSDDSTPEGNFLSFQNGGTCGAP